jgi:hypothetical protein
MGKVDSHLGKNRKNWNGGRDDENELRKELLKGLRASIRREEQSEKRAQTMRVLKDRMAKIDSGEVQMYTWEEAEAIRIQQAVTTQAD